MPLRDRSRSGGAPASQGPAGEAAGPHAGAAAAPNEAAAVQAGWSQVGQDQAVSDHDDDHDVDSHGESDDSEGHPQGADPEVFELRCATAGCVLRLSSRGTKVWLVADPSASLYSTDIPTEAVREADFVQLPSCACRARSVLCTKCLAAVGYHVVEPCSPCASAEHNGHYWLFYAHAVTGTSRGLVWSALPYNGATEETATEFAAGWVGNSDRPHRARGGVAEGCCICMASPMWRPTRVRSCGHMFCFGCISREVDARGRCPMDRQGVDRGLLEPVHSEQHPL